MAGDSNGHIGLADVIGKIEATILIGLSTVGGAFTEAIVREMARKVQRPIIFPISNPTIKIRSESRGFDPMDRCSRSHCDWFAICARQLQRANDSHRPVQ